MNVPQSFRRLVSPMMQEMLAMPSLFAPALSMRLPSSLAPIRMRNPSRALDSWHLFDSPLFSTSFDSSVTGISIDVDEDDTKFVIKADMPSGIRKEDLKVSIQDDILTIQGEKKEENRTDESKQCRSERVFGSFQRSLSMPCPVNSEAIGAAFKDGILSLTLPKMPIPEKTGVDIAIS